MLEALKQQVYEANMQLPARGLVTFTWGNVSGIDRERGLVVIKPSGVAYEALSPDKMVVVRLADGAVVEGALRPSSDTPTHLMLYRAFRSVGGIVHTHSRYATSFAQAQREIPPLGTTHADSFYGSIPCTRLLTEQEVMCDYEENTGRVIAEAFAELDETAVPGVLAACHGPFAWGCDPAEAVYHAAVLEEVACMALQTMLLSEEAQPICQFILDKHYRRKHGADAYYGQK